MKKAILFAFLFVLMFSGVLAADSVKTIDAKDGKLIINIEKGEVTYQDITTPIIVDYFVFPDESIPFSDTPILVKDNKELDRKIAQVMDEDYNDYKIEKDVLKDSRGFVHLVYYDPNNASDIALDVYIEDTFYAVNQAALDDFWDKFFPRFQKMKGLT